MATKKTCKPKKYVRFSWETLDLICEWTNCVEKFTHLTDFMHHVRNHIIFYIPEDDYVCQWSGCNFQAVEAKELRRHIFYHAFHSKIKCYGKNFANRNDSLPPCVMDSINRNLIPDLPEELVCLWKQCDDLFENAEAFYRHVEAHAEENPKGKKLSVKIICQWEGCTTSLTTLYRLKEHLRTHTQEKVAACPNCGSMFSSRTKFLDHLQRQASINNSTTDSIANDNEKTLQCIYCRKFFTSERLLRNHMQGHVNHYKCPYCDMTVSTPSNLKAHILYRHSEERNFPCKICDYKAKSNTDLVRHLEKHRTNESFSCPMEMCPYSTKSNVSLSKHMSSIHKINGISYLCHLCDKKFSRGNYLTKHLIGNHGLRWPSGHSRFRYQLQSDGFFHLQTIRYESYELSEVMMQEEEKKAKLAQNEGFNDSNENSENPDEPSSSCETQTSIDNTNIYQIGSNDIVQLSTISIPVVMVVNHENNDLIQTGQELEFTDKTASVSAVNCEGPVMYMNVNCEKSTLLNSGDIDTTANKKIRLVSKKCDGSTIVEMAEVIAEAPATTYI